MKLPSPASIATLADVLTLVSLPVTIGAALLFPETAEQLRGPLVGVLSLLFAWLVVAGYRRYDQIKERKHSEPTLPRVLLVGGTADRTMIDEITQHPLLNREPYILFIEAVVPANGLVQEVQRADALILMPDFTKANFPEAYELVMKRCQSATIPMARYYPSGYAAARATDVHTIPFDTTQGIVNYAAEFLLKRAVDRGRYVESRLRLQRGLTWVCAVSTICFAVWAWRDHTQLDHSKRQLELPPAHHQEVAAALAEYRESLSKIVDPPLEAATNRLAARLAQLIVQDLNRLTPTGTNLRLTLYSLTADKLTLTPMATSGAPGYALNAKSSVAGCSFWHRLAVHWIGDGDITNRIAAFHLDGKPVGRFDAKDSVLILPNGGECSYDNRQQGDPKTDLLCIPVAVDESRNGSPVPSVGCLSSEGEESPIGEPWLIPYLERSFLVFGTLRTGAEDSEPSRRETD